MIEVFKDLVKNNKNFVITSHVNPDGDSLGSALALYYFLLNEGKSARFINVSETPRNYRFLDKKNVIELFSVNSHKKLIEEADLIVIVDTNEYLRLKSMGEVIKSGSVRTLCIDHHVQLGKNGFDFSIIDTESPATGEIIFKLFKEFDKDLITEEIAEALYTAIMTDTGSYRFPRTDSETHLITAELIKLGADPVYVYNEVYDKVSIGVIKLLTRFLDRLQFLYDEKLAYAVIRIKDFEETGTDIMDTDGFSKQMMSIDTVKLSIIFTESKNGVKISFRSKGNIPANKLAAEFGGGGHLNAAGTFIYKPDISLLIENVLSKSKEFIN
jgi:bifunctional oligoribonuclease and PAP phosphatase NrnA